jgi:hypothetical protein
MNQFNLTAERMLGSIHGEKCSGQPMEEELKKQRFGCVIHKK